MNKDPFAMSFMSTDCSSMEIPSDGSVQVVVFAASASNVWGQINADRLNSGRSVIGQDGSSDDTIQ